MKKSKGRNQCLSNMDQNESSKARREREEEYKKLIETREKILKREMDEFAELLLDIYEWNQKNNGSNP